MNYTTSNSLASTGAHSSMMLLTDPSFWFTILLLLVIACFCGLYGQFCGERMEDYEPNNNIHGSRMTHKEIRETLEKHKMVVTREDLVKKLINLIYC